MRLGTLVGDGCTLRHIAHAGRIVQVRCDQLDPLRHLVHASRAAYYAHRLSLTHQLLHHRPAHRTGAKPDV